MAQDLVHEVTLWEPDLGANITPVGTTIWKQVKEFKLVERLGEIEEAVFTFFRGAPLPLDTVLTERTILKVQYGNPAVSYKLFRVVKIDLDATGNKDTVVHCRAMWSDLANVVVRQTRANGFGDLSVTLVGQTLSQALTEIVATDHNLPSTFILGTVETEVASEKVIVQYYAATFLQVLQDLTSQIQTKDEYGAEYEFVWDNANTRYTINVYRQIGWSSAERTAGSPSPSSRPIHGPNNSTTSNRLSMDYSRDARTFFNRIIPLSGDDENPVNIAGALFYVDAASATTVDLEADVRIVHKDGQFTGAWFGNDTDGFVQVTGSDTDGGAGSSNRLTFASGASVLNNKWCRFAINTGGDDQVFIDDYASVQDHGAVEKTKTFPDISPYPNLLVQEGITPSMDAFTSGLTDGWAKIGTPTTTGETGTEFFRFGQGAQKVVTTADNEGIEASFTVEDDDKNPHVSCWVHLRSDGTNLVRIEFEDVNGDIQPITERAESNVNELRGIALGGFELPPGTANLKIYAPTSGTTFYVDAVAITQSPTPYEYRDRMGPSALFHEGVVELSKEGGMPPPIVSGDFLDITAISAGTEVLLGSHVEYKDVYSGTGSPIITANSRVVEIETREGKFEGRFLKKIRLSDKRKDFSGRFRGVKRWVLNRQAPTHKGPVISSVTWKWVQSLISGNYSLVFAWFADRDATKSIKWEFNADDVEPDWTTIPTGGTYDGTDDLDATVETSIVVISDVDPFTEQYLYLAAYPDASGAGVKGQTKRVALTPLPGGPFTNPGCFHTVEKEALFGAVQVPDDATVFLNEITDLSATPNGSLEGTIGNWTWGTSGLSKTVTGTTEHVQLANDLLGATTPNRLTVFNQLRRDTASEISVWRVTAGVQTVIEQKILTTGVVRLAVTDEGGSTTNIDSEPTVENGEWAGVGHSLVPNGTYTTIYSYVLNKDNEESIQKLAIINANVSLDFTDIKLFYSGELTIRLSHWLVQAWTKSMFNSEAICARDFTVNEGVDPGDVTNPQPAMIFRTDAGIEIYDLAGNQAYDWADASFTPGGLICRPAYHPGLARVFYASTRYVRSALVDGTSQVTEYDVGVGGTVWGLQYSPANGRLYVFHDGGGNNFGHLSGASGAMSFNSLFTTKDMADFFADAAHNVLIYEDLTDDDLYALVLSTFAQLDTSTEISLYGVWYTRSEQGAYFMDTGGDVYRQFASNTPLFATTQVQMVEGSGFTTPRANTLMIYEEFRFAGLMFLVANDHIMVGPVALGTEFPDTLTSSDFADIATLGDVCRGASLAQINISPALAAPVLSLGTETSTTVPLTWTNIAGETNYVLQQATAGATGPFTTIESPVADATSYTVTGLTAETNYWYRIRGHNAAGAGPWSNVVAATTEATPAKLLLYLEDDGISQAIWKMTVDGVTATELTGLSVDMNHVTGGTSRGNGPEWVGSQNRIAYGNGTKVMTCDIDGNGEAERFDSGVASTKWVSFDYDAANDRLYACRDTVAAASISWGYFSDLGSATWTWNEIKTANKTGEIYLDVANSHIYNQGFPSGDYGTIYRTPIGTWDATGSPNTGDHEIESLAVDNTNNFVYGLRELKVLRWPQSDITVSPTTVIDFALGTPNTKPDQIQNGCLCVDEATQIGYVSGLDGTLGNIVVSFDLSTTGQDSDDGTVLHDIAGIGACYGLSLIEP